MSRRDYCKSKRGYGHPHHLFQLPTMADTAACKDLVKEDEKTTQPLTDHHEKPVNALTASTRYVVNKCALFYEALQKNPVFK